MKIRHGFVSNSSSSSFIMGLRVDNAHDHLMNILSNTAVPPDRKLVEELVRASYRRNERVISKTIDYIVGNSMDLELDVRDNYSSGQTVESVHGPYVSDIIRKHKESMIFYVVTVEDGDIDIDSFTTTFGENFIIIDAGAR